MRREQTQDRASRLLRCGVAAVVAGSLMLPAAAWAQPGEGSSADVAAAGEAESDSSDESEQFDPDQLLAYAGDAGKEGSSDAEGGALADLDDGAQPDENVTIIVQLEEGDQGVGLFSRLFGTATQDRHSYFKDKIRALAADAAGDRAGGAQLLSADSAETVQELHDYYHAIDGFAVKAPASTLESIKALDGVKNAFVETIYYLPDESTEAGEGLQNQTSLDMTGADQVDQKGDGQVIAIIDSGLDTDHEAFSGDLDDDGVVYSQSAMEEAMSGLEAGSQGAYISEKIPFVYDYADGDADVNPSAAASEHGTHVAGIAAANAGEIRGTAPNAQIMMMKVAMDANGGLPDSAILAALDDAAALQVDAVNLSLGMDGGFSDAASSTYTDAFSALDEEGTTLNVAAGNAYSAAYANQSGQNLPYASDPDSGVVSNPAALQDAFAVASVDNEMGVPYFTGAGRQIGYTEFTSANGSNCPSFGERVSNGDYAVVDGGIGSAEDASRLMNEYGWDYDWSKTMVLVQRGGTDEAGNSLSFTQKINNIWGSASSVAAVIVYNNEDGELSNPGVDSGIWTPAVFIGKADGEALLAQEGATITVQQGQTLPASTDYSVSDFSSWGVTPDLELKPEVAAPGGSIYSSVLDGGYAYMSGTSMATPQMTGISALVREYLDESPLFEGMDESQKSDAVTQLLMSTATPLASGQDSYYSPRQQGAGLANVPAALSSEVLATVDGAANPSRPKADLGESATGSWSFTVTLQNLGDSDRAFNVDAAALSEEVADGLFQQTSRNWTGQGIDVAFGGDVRNGAVTVPAGGTASVVVSVTCADEFASWAAANTPNGTFVTASRFWTLWTKTGLTCPFPSWASMATGARRRRLTASCLTAATTSTEAPWWTPATCTRWG